MINYTIKVLFTCLMGLLIMLIGLTGCEEKIVPGESGNIIKIMTSNRIAYGENSEAFAEYRLTITADDIATPIVVPLELDGAFLIGEVILVAGANRLFTLEVFDTDGVAVYSGSTTANVVRGESITLNVDLLPVAPLMKITPRYDEKFMEESFTVDVNCFNLVGLSSIQFDFLYGSTDNLVFVDSVIKGPDYGIEVRLSYQVGSNIVTVWIDLAFLTGNIVDANGDATMATVYLSTHSDTQLLVDTANLQVVPVSLNRANGDVIDPFPDKVYLDESMIVLTQLIF